MKQNIITYKKDSSIKLSLLLLAIMAMGQNTTVFSNQKNIDVASVAGKLQNNEQDFTESVIAQKFVEMLPGTMVTGSIAVNIEKNDAQIYTVHKSHDFVAQALKPGNLIDKTIVTGTINKEPSKIKRKKSKKFQLFGAPAIGFGKIKAGVRFANYTNSMAESHNNLESLCNSNKCKIMFDKLRSNLDRSGGKFKSKLNYVNHFVNSTIEYKTDKSIHDRLDKWSLPHQTLHSGVGDCEDYAILKMGLLANLGVPKKAMSVIVLEDTKRGLYHAVLAVRTNAGIFILDNASRKVKKDTQIQNYRPLYSVGVNKNYIFGVKKSGNKQFASNRNFLNIAPGSDILSE
ncbi:MAG: transglutaminase-like cysteine peptidase [Gammaproteobacteria bacterium]